MFGDEFGFDYYRQQHEERVQAAERERLLRRIAAERRREDSQRPLGKRVLAATGARLVAVGSRLQAAGAA